MPYPPAVNTDPIAEIAPDVFMIRGSVRINPVTRFSRNMAVIRQGGALTVVNPMRLKPQREAELLALGTPRHVLRLGAYHGKDDPYYCDTHGMEMWSQAGGTTYTEPAIDHVLTAEGALPFSNAQLFVFEGLNQPEGALFFPGSRLLLTCDAIQHYGDYSQCSLFAKLMMPRIGFPKTTVVGPLWLKGMVPEGESIEGEFRRLLTLDFDSLLSAHGTFLATGANKAVAAAVDRAFG